MPLSEVPRIQLSDDGTKITLDVHVSGFHPGQPVELSGYATQSNGNIATFYQIVQIPQDSKGEDTFTLADVPINGTDGFKPGNPITVVTRATDAWITTLFTDQANPRTWNSDPKLYHSAWSTPPLSTPTPW